SAASAPRGKSCPPVQIHAHLCPQCGTMDVDGRPVTRDEAERLQCDAAIAAPSGRNTTTIPPRTRRQVLARDRHRCQSPGCHRRHYLEVHHVTPRARGGTNEASNLVTLCASCHRVWHERRG
ncbi:MAG TPA: HNH endonuclease, partial [Candidatus Krumholzibacteria bacterium]|nr:HNH endonuclease [Candidatus Krumholzibacteria bacterium]